MSTMQVQIPEGAKEGTVFTVAQPDGQQIQVQVPPGASAGQTMMVPIQGAQQPQMAQAVAVPQSVQVQVQNQPQLPPYAYGAQPGGTIQNEAYCGIITCLIGVFVFPCVCCCPCDQRQVYTAPNGQKYHSEAAICDC